MSRFITGASGAGKTSFINCLTGFAEPSSGSITVRGARLVSRDPAVRPARGIVRTFQHPETFSRLTCLENVLVPLDRAHRRSLIESCVFRAVAELLGKDPWDIAPERYRHF